MIYCFQFCFNFAVKSNLRHYSKACVTAEQARQLESHYFRLGKTEGKTFGCAGGSVDALCYGNRYPELQTKFCDGGACHGVRVNELLKQHYEQWGRFQGKQYGCPSASTAEDMCLGNTLETTGAADTGRIRNALATTGMSSGDFYIQRFTAWTVPKPTGKPVAKADFDWLAAQIGAPALKPEDVDVVFDTAKLNEPADYRKYSWRGQFHAACDGVADNKMLLIVAWLSTGRTVVAKTTARLQKVGGVYKDPSAELYELTGRRKYVLSGDSGKQRESVQTSKDSIPVISFGDADFALDGTDNAGPVCFKYYAKGDFFFTPADETVHDQWFAEGDHMWDQLPGRDLCGAANGALGTFRVQAWVVMAPAPPPPPPWDTVPPSPPFAPAPPLPRAPPAPDNTNPWDACSTRSDYDSEDSLPVVRVAFLSVANPYIGHRYEEEKQNGAAERRRTLLGGAPKSFTKSYKSAPMFARSSLYAVCKKTYTAAASLGRQHGERTNPSEVEAKSARRRLLGGDPAPSTTFDIYHGRVDPGIAKNSSDKSLSKEERQKMRWGGDQFKGEGCEVRFGGVGMMDDPDDASLKYMGGADSFAWDNKNMSYGEANIFNLPSLVSNMHDTGVTGVECRLMESDTRKGQNAEDYSLDEGDGVDDSNANGAQDIKYEGISANENEQLSMKQYSLEHMKKFCSDPAIVASETPAECCQDQRHIRNVKYLSCDVARASRKLLGGNAASDPNMDHCREVEQPDNVFDTNLRYKISSSGYKNRMKFIKNGKGLYAGVLDTYNDMPVDLQTGKMCVFLQVGPAINHSNCPSTHFPTLSLE